ncbi:MAG: hypothetical protein AABM29_02185 [Actinomycetota bacterium]
MARATLAPSPLIYWAGILIIGLPIFYRLLSREASPGERLALVCVLAMALYGVKLAQEPFLFTFPDEFTHSYNANQIELHHHLFHPNSLLVVSPYYPGLEGATSALMMLTGMSSYVAGIIVVGAARLTLVIALFLLFGRISGSARIAGIGVAIYAGNPNFMFFGAQYSYGSLALPLLVVLLMALAERDAFPRSWSWAWSVPIVLGTAALVVTHHLTSYALTGILLTLALAHVLVHRRVEWRNPLPFAILAGGLSAIWLLVVASATLSYLEAPLARAIRETWNTITGDTGTRDLFQSGGSSSGTRVPVSTPVVAQIFAFASVVILLIGLPLGLWQVWRRHRTKAFALMFSLAAIGFFGVLGLRFAPAAWEAGNRAAEYLFLGLAFVVALAIVSVYSLLEGRRVRLGRGLLTACLGVLLTGGAISGWPWDQHLAQPITATSDGRRFESEPLGMARWARGHFPGQKFAATEIDARLLIDPGGARVYSGYTLEVQDILDATKLEPWHTADLRRNKTRYVVADRRRTSRDLIRGYFLSLLPPAGKRYRPLPRGTTAKFEQIPTAARMFDSGNIVVFDIEAGR